LATYRQERIVAVKVLVMKSILLLAVVGFIGVAPGQDAITFNNRVATFIGVAPGQDAITFTNRLATFTNLQGEVFRDVRLVRADADGIIYRETVGVGGGRVFYTNLPQPVLKSLGLLKASPESTGTPTFTNNWEYIQTIMKSATNGDFDGASNITTQWADDWEKRFRVFTNLCSSFGDTNAELKKSNYGPVTLTDSSGNAVTDAYVTALGASYLLYRTPGTGGGRLAFDRVPDEIRKHFGIDENAVDMARQLEASKNAKQQQYLQQQAQQAQEEMDARAMAKKLRDLEVAGYGRVIQVTDKGALVDVGGNSEVSLVLLSDYPKQLIDGASVSFPGFSSRSAQEAYARREGPTSAEAAFASRYGLGGRQERHQVAASPGDLRAYSIGVYKYVSVKGAEQTVRHYTCSRAKAVAYIETLQLQNAP
jgi:hypothetical protein